MKTGFGKVLAAACATFSLSSALGATVLYVKPDGTGSGISWADAAGLEAAVATATAAGTAHDLYLAQGVYYPSATVKLTDGVSLYGSFPGLSEAETLDDRSLADTPTNVRRPDVGCVQDTCPPYGTILLVR